MARPKAAVIDEQAVTLTTTKPPEGSHRIVLAIVDEAGRVQSQAWDMPAPAFRHLPERYSWEQYFYPAIVKLMQ